MTPLSSGVESRPACSTNFTMNRYAQIIPLLQSILRRTERIGWFRVQIISFFMPEFREILGDLSKIGEVVDKNIAP